MTFWLRTFQLGIKSLLLHPLRSLLTVLGIFIGVASVIWLLAIGEGISQKAQEQIAELGANNIIVRLIKPPEVMDFNRDDAYGSPVTTSNDSPRRSHRRAGACRFADSPPFSYAHRRRWPAVGCTPEYAEVTLSVDPATSLRTLS